MDKKENVTKYDEFVCSAFDWLPLEEQKTKANKLAKSTKKDKGHASKEEAD